MLSSTERETQKNKERKERNQKRKDNRGAGRVSRLHDKANTSGRRRKVLWRFGLYVCWGLQSWSSLDTLNRWTKMAVYEGRLIWEQQQSAYVCVCRTCAFECVFGILCLAHVQMYGDRHVSGRQHPLWACKRMCGPFTANTLPVSAKEALIAGFYKNNTESSNNSWRVWSFRFPESFAVKEVK